MPFPGSLAASLFALTAIAFEAKAMGLAASLPTATLGQALDFSVTVRLDAGEALTSNCVRAEVQQGDSTVPSTLVAAIVERGLSADEAIVRVRTGVTIQEPIVSIQLALGCPTRVMRRYTVLVDPPSLVAQTPPAATPSSPSSTAAVALPSAEAVSAAGAAAVTTAPVAATAAVPVSMPDAAAPPSRPNAAASPEPARPPPVARKAAPRRAAAQGRPMAATAAAAPKSRLQLAPLEPSPELLAAQSRAAEAQASALAAAAAASAAEARLRDMEAAVAQMRKDAQADRLAVEQLRTRLSETQASADLLPWLVGLCGLLAAACAALAWRLRQAARERPAWWRTDEAEPLAAGTASPATEARASVDVMVDRPADRPVDAVPNAAPPRPFDPSTTSPTVLLTPMPTAVAPPPATRPAEPPAPAAGTGWDDVTAEEQIDLEQQVDFFVVLGQEDSAIDLLLSHLRRTGGTAPMPYLKLLALHRSRGERAAYERMRDRFNQRFNGVAPEWDHDPKASRHLEDYPTSVQRLQRLWPQPLDAMAALEAMLFRRGDGAELFDLPAYHDVLFLYQIARELRQPRVGAADDVVDVLLPLGDPEDSMFALEAPASRPPAAGPRPGRAAAVTAMSAAALAAEADDADTGEAGTVDLELELELEGHEPGPVAFLHSAPVDLDLGLPADPPSRR